MTNRQWGALALLPLLALGGCKSDTPPASAPTATTAPKVLQEDDPGWDCRTMGNRTCGPTEEDRDICRRLAGARDWTQFVLQVAAADPTDTRLDEGIARLLDATDEDAAYNAGEAVGERCAEILR